MSIRHTIHLVTVLISTACIAQPGTLDTTFYPILYNFPGSIGFGGSANNEVSTLAILDDGKVLVGGMFNNYMGSTVPRFMRVTASGRLDPSFNTGGSGPNGYVYKIVVQPDGRILLAGTFTMYNGSPRRGVARLHADGTLDPSFDVGTGASLSSPSQTLPANIQALGLTASGQVLVGGMFSRFNGFASKYLVRLNPDGSVDETFVSTMGTPEDEYGWVNEILIRPDGSLLLGGERLPDEIRLLTSEGADGGHPPTGAPFVWLRSMALLPSGKFLAAGWPWFGDALCRFNSNGLRDNTFPQLVTVPFDAHVNKVLVQPDGKILIGGTFTSINGVPRNKLARLHPDGSLDLSFGPGPQIPWNVKTMAQQFDGNILVGGLLSSGPTGPDLPVPRHLCRISGDGGLRTFQLRPRVRLEGAYDPDTGLMRDDLRVQGMIPLVEPYSGLGYVHVGGGGGETVVASVLALSGNNAIVDWVVVELRTLGPLFERVYTKSALLQRDGDIVSVNGVAPLQFVLPVPARYQVAVRHRNHLGAMAASASYFTVQALTVDLTMVPMFGEEACRSITGVYPSQVLWSGDVNRDGRVSYLGVANDRDRVLQGVGGSTVTTIATGYHSADVNLDGAVKYTGAANDRDPILGSIGGSVPTQVRIQQLP